MEAWKVKEAVEKLMKDDPVSGPNVQPIASNDLKESVYWAITFIDKTRALIAGILGSAPRLEKAGVKYWVLPTGDKVRKLFNDAVIHSTYRQFCGSGSSCIFASHNLGNGSNPHLQCIYGS